MVMEDHDKQKTLGDDSRTNRRMTLRSAFKQQQQQEQGEGERPNEKKRKKSAQKKKKQKPVVNEDHILMRKRYREFTSEEKAAYTKKAHESGGFDVGEVPSDVVAMNLIRPSRFEERPKLLKEFTRLAKRALRDFNKQHGTRFQFVKLIRVNIRLAAGPVHYITFQAMDLLGAFAPPLQTFQAVVRTLLKQTFVLFCRFEEKPKLSEGPGQPRQPPQPQPQS